MELYEYRCFKRLKSWNAPVSGWECFDMHVNHHNGKKITSFLSAIYAAFDLVDPPVRGSRL